MFSTFTTRDGYTLLIRSVDMRVIEDTVNGCMITWESTPGQLRSRAIQGTAHENLERLKAEELATIMAAQRMQQRQERGQPMMPVLRGRGH